MQRFPWVGRLVLVSAVLAAGCSGSGPTPVDVKGAVSLDGQPMPEGDVAFRSGDGRPPVHGKIDNGHYTIRTLPGDYTVEINHYRDSGKKDPYGQPEMISDVPPRYNIKSELKAEVKPGGPNDFDFKVASH